MKGLTAICLSIALMAATAHAQDSSVLMIAEQGSFAVGGTVLVDAQGHTYHGDHAYVFYQKPVDARPLPVTLSGRIEAREAPMEAFLQFTKIPIIIYFGDNLPEIGLHGNTPFPFSDLNNVEVSDHLSQWFHEKKLD